MPSDTASIQTVAEVLPDPISDAKEDKDQDGDQDGIELDQFPEGGTKAWCAVLGG